MAKRLTDKQKEEIVESFKSGKDIDTLARENKCTNLTIIRNLKKKLGELKYKELINKSKSIKEKPKINKYVSKMIKNISTLLQIKNTSVSIKATTNEKIGFIGNGEGIAAESIVHITDDKIN